MVDYKKEASRILYEASRETWGNRKGLLGEIVVPFDDFSGLRYIDVSNLPTGTVMGGGSDGIGTKIEVAERVGNHSTIPHNLFAMLADDALVRGAEPVLVQTVLDVNSLGEYGLKCIKQLAEGYVEAARLAGVAVINGETAELGERVSGYRTFNYNWSGSLIWFGKKEKLFTGMEINEGDSLIGLYEPGFRSNGFTKLREILKFVHGHDWHSTIWKGDQTLGDLALTPSKIYSRAIVGLHGVYKNLSRVHIKGIAHISGGGIPEKLGRVLQPSGLGAIIDSPFEPPEFMKYVQAYGNITDVDAYRTWCMGHGMIAITNKNWEREFIHTIKECGIDAQRIGHVTDKPGIRIANKGAFNPKNCKELAKSNPHKKLQGPGVLEF